ncbi:hypothetical protein RRG08_049726 [Elysia crispata]|uniref:Uncharacterized protein n=1 Tax=Elysia crispata TaxID=231223 RepID=A0AAE0Y8C5_9GAST|nr:hypothetical protein RRG08_049726 [Elysia crispata]
MEPRPLILLVSTEAGTTQLDETIGHSITKEQRHKALNKEDKNAIKFNLGSDDYLTTLPEHNAVYKTESPTTLAAATPSEWANDSHA